MLEERGEDSLDWTKKMLERRDGLDRIDRVDLGKVEITKGN